MATLTIINNPFDPINSREIKEVESGKKIYEVIDGFYAYFEVAVSVNGQITDDYEYTIKDDDSIAFVPIPEGGGGGKNPFAIVAMIALMVVAPYAGAYAGILMGSTVAYSVAYASTLVLGGMLINNLLPPEMPDFNNPMNDGLKSSPTYGWDNVANQTNDGVVIPVVYGKTRIVPPIISQYVETQDNKQYLNILMALNDGEIKSVSDIKINNTDLSFFDNVTTEIRLGNNYQSLIPTFDNTRIDTSVGVKLNTSPTTRQTKNNAVRGINLNVTAPNGIFYANNAGGFSSRTVDLVVRYREVGATAWIILPNTSIGGSTSSAIRRTYSISNLIPSQYEVQVYRVSAESTSNRVSEKVYFDSLTEIIYDDFLYPNTALLAIRALATDQLSGNAPRISAVVESLDGLSNPSIAAADLLKRTNAKIVENKFIEWAQFCDSQNYQVHIAFDSEITVKDGLNILGLLGRANVLQIGSEYTPIIDKSESVSTQKFLFTMGNILKDSFEEKYLPLSDRSNVIEVTYYDKDFDYEKQTVTLYQNGFDESLDTARKTSITLYGCASRDQAIKHGRYLLNRNRYLTNTISFEADIDAIACTVGDVISVSHDVPQWGYSGRIKAIDSTHIHLDKKIPFEAGKNYQISVRDSLTDEIQTIDLNDINTTLEADTIEIPLAEHNPINEYDIYSLGEINKSNKKFRVISITRSSDMRRKINAIEYVPEIYDDNTDVFSTIDYSLLDDVSSLLADTIYEINATGYSISVINLSWIGVGLAWNVYYRQVGETKWILHGRTTSNSYKIYNLPPDEYEFKVGNKTTTLLLENAPKAPNILGVIATKKYTACQFQIEFEYFDDFNHIEIYESPLGGTINDAKKVGTSTEQIYIRNGLNVIDSRNYWFRLVDKHGFIGDFFGAIIGETETNISAIISDLKNQLGTDGYRPQLSDILVAGTIGGQNVLGISSDVIVDGTITAEKLAIMGVSTFTNDVGYTDDTLANSAITLANSKTKAYYQTTAPTGLNATDKGDLWIDTDDNNKLYIWDGSQWILGQDSNTALSIANNALSTASSKIYAYYQASQPSGGNNGDIWFDTDDNNKIYTKYNNSWVLASDTRIATAISSAQTAQTTADGKAVVYYQTAQPTGQTANDKGDIWIDTDDNNKLYIYSGTAWILGQDYYTALTTANTANTTANTALTTANSKNKTYSQATAPSSGMLLGDLWIDTDDNNKMYRYDGSNWVSVSPTISGSGIKTFYQATSPTATTIGDLWFDTDDNNKTYRWDGSAWQSATMDAAYAINNNTTTVNGAKITTGSITASQIATDTITSSQIAAGAITAAEIASSAVTADKINVTSLSAISSNIGTITAGTINASLITAGTISVARLPGLSVQNLNQRTTDITITKGTPTNTSWGVSSVPSNPTGSWTTVATFSHTKSTAKIRFDCSLSLNGQGSSSYSGTGFLWVRLTRGSTEIAKYCLGRASNLSLIQQPNGARTSFNFVETYATAGTYTYNLQLTTTNQLSTDAAWHCTDAFMSSLEIVV